MSPQRPRAARIRRSPSPRRFGRRTGLVGRVLVVLMLAAISLIGLGGGVASAGGFDCKDVPSPEFPNLRRRSASRLPAASRYSGC